MRADSLWSNIFKREKKPESLLEILRSNPIFVDLKEREISQLAQIIHARTFEEGEVIFQEGEPGAGMYVIVEGSVKVCTYTYESEEIELARLERGDFFGEIALLDESPRSATALAMERTRLIGLFKPDLFDLIDRNPAAGVKIILRLSQVLAARLRRTNEELRRIHGKATPEH